jgi:hypothetical protein
MFDYGCYIKIKAGL